MLHSLIATNVALDLELIKFSHPVDVKDDRQQNHAYHIEILILAMV